jgi:orotate phosphoribosyltransferase
VTVGRDPGTDCFRSPTGTAVAVGSINDCEEEPVTGADSEREELARLVRELGVVHGRVTLASGAEAEYYVDLRRVTLHHRAAPLVGRLMRVLTADWDYGAVGGLTLGADPVADAVLHAVSAERATNPDLQPVDAFVVRKATKEHGLQRLIEGPDVTGRRVLVVEDTSTTGASPLDAALAAQEAGATVVAVATIADRATGAAERFADAGFEYRHVFGLEDLGLA